MITPPGLLFGERSAAENRQHVAGRILEPRDVGTHARSLAARDAPVILVEPVVSLELDSRVGKLVNGAIDSFVRAAAIELPRGLRINAISPGVLVESLPSYGPYFRGHEAVPGKRVANAYVKSVEGVLNFFNSNKQVFDWLTEMALPEQRKAIVDAFNRRKGQIEGGFTDVAPRRRSAS